MRPADTPSSSVNQAVLLIMLLIKVMVVGFKGPAGIFSLLMLFPFYLSLVSVLDSLASPSAIRSWNKHRGCFDWIEKDTQPVQYWLALLISWPAVVMFGWFFFAL